MAEGGDAGGQPVRFTGDSEAYFGIWIANAFLSGITLGIFSAWAKVRDTKYFYGNTFVLGESFVYHATGGQILKGRLIAVFAILFFFFIYMMGQPLISFALDLIYLFLIPLVLNKSFKFNARMTSWRNVRFDWHGNYWGTFKIFYLYPLMCILSFGLAIPRCARATAKYYLKSHSLGTTRFSFGAKKSQYWSALGGAFIVFLCSAAIPAGALLLFASPAFVIYAFPVGILFAFLFFNAAALRILFRHLVLGQVAEFKSSLSVKKFMWISISNFLACLGTFFLVFPWARIRMHKYIAETVSVMPRAGIDAFTDEKTDDISSLAEEFAEIEGIDLGFGV